MTTKPAATAVQRCLNASCGSEYPISQTLVACPRCGELLDVEYAWPGGFDPGYWGTVERRTLTKGSRAGAGATPATASALDFSGVWRFRDLLPFYRDESQIVTIGEGRTNLQRAEGLAAKLGFKENLYLQYEGFNPSGSFKDNGMAAAFTHAKMVGASRVACASTGNTSAALAVYGALTGTRCFVFIGDGKIAYGKLSQALEYGATTLQVAGDFDACLARVREIAEKRPEVGVYLMNSVNPFRLEGQKTIMYRVLEGLDWRVPDWIVVPGGNLGNCSAFGKAFMELKALGVIDRLPRLAVIQAQGSRTLDRIVNELGVKWRAAGVGAACEGCTCGAAQGSAGRLCLAGEYDRDAVAGEYARMDAANERAHTVATAIEINRPVNLPKALRALHAMNGVVRSVSDAEIVEHKALVGRYGFGCEPASGASVAGAAMLLREGVIKPDETVVCILTGHVLKDPDVTVGYHTGLNMKAGAVDLAACTPTGRVSNPPVKVPDDIDAILRAMGVSGA
ncbi:MAG: threonine synthase [Planctomycetes bacterium]|nr:threonine synthase [Planctomycetota bacterium]